MVNPDVFVDGKLLTETIATYFECPREQRAIIKKMTVSNATIAAVAVSLYRVPVTKAAGNAYLIWNQKSVGINETREVFEFENHVLLPGDFIAAVGLDVSLMVSGVLVALNA